MTRPAATSTRSGSDESTIVKAVTVIMGVVVGLTFLFGVEQVRLSRAGSSSSPWGAGGVSVSGHR
jgi:hypothetical protein